jgi:hypothetical protein
MPKTGGSMLAALLLGCLAVAAQVDQAPTAGLSSSSDDASVGSVRTRLGYVVNAARGLPRSRARATPLSDACSPRLTRLARSHRRSPFRRRCLRRSLR